jgi:hypothetical protein
VALTLVIDGKRTPSSFVHYLDDSFRPHNIPCNKTLSIPPTCIPRLFRRLVWKLETASDTKSARLSSHHKKSTSAIAGSASLATCIASSASWISFSFSTIRVGGHERATISAIRLVNGQQIVSALDSQFSPCRQMLKRLRCRQNGWLYHAHN